MSDEPKRYLVTSALPYANGLKHIGHLAGAYLPADFYVRFLRAQKKDVVFVCGSDEHGTAIPIQAMKEGTTPQHIIDKYHGIIRENLEELHISFDIYDRTSAPIHHETAQEFFNYLNDRGALEMRESEQYYDEQAAVFLADRYIKGICPRCGYDGAYGDQCEKCGSTLSPDELVNPVSTLSGMPPVKRSTRHWYLPLDRHESWLRQWILEEHAGDWKPNVLGQCKSWIDAGLQPRAVTRDLDWGVKVPPEAIEKTGAEGMQQKVLYVWFDAPIGYISATRTWSEKQGRDWKSYWTDPGTRLVHFIGKDNIVFHCIIFPVMLKLRGYIVPQFVPANEFMNLEGSKMSTSRNWKLDMQDYIDDFIRKDNGGDQMVDALRYYLATILPESKDSEFTWKGFQDAVNNELVAVFANFFNRSLVLMHKLCGGKVPKYHPAQDDEKDEGIRGAIMATRGSMEKKMEIFSFREALFEVISLARAGNRYMQDKEPWILAKQLQEIRSGSAGDHGNNEESLQQRIDNCLHLCLQLCANLAIYIQPFLPSTARKMCHMMKVVDRMLEWQHAGSLKLLSVGYSLRPPSLLFRKIGDEEVEAQIIKLQQGLERSKMEQQDINAGGKPAHEENKKPEIQYDDFAKLELRIGTITAAEKVAKADKLLKLQVSVGNETRTIVSGIAQHFTAEGLLNRQVMVVVNLAPRRMRGIESQGMILTAEEPGGRLVLVGPAEPVGDGSEVR